MSIMSNQLNQFNSDHWYTHSIFKHYWKHYNEVNEWLTRNGYKALRFDVMDECCESESGRELKAGMDELEDISEQEVNAVFSDDLIEDESSDADISDEYLQFIMQTKAHQMERRRLRSRLAKERDGVEYVDISTIDTSFKRSCAPKRNAKQHEVSAKRNSKMSELYGEDANIIQGMEAALQLNFDRLCDLHRPKCWPVIPIRI